MCWSLLLIKLHSFNPATLLKRDSEVAVSRCSIKKVLLEISQNSQENTCARVSFLINNQARDLQKSLLETLPKSKNPC